MKNLRLALRSLLHFRLYTAINLAGLALCLACVIVIFRYVHSEYTVDRFNKNLDRIFATTYEAGNRTGMVTFSGIDNPNREKTFVDLRLDPAVESASNFIVLPGEDISPEEERKVTANVIVADTNFLRILDYPVAHGSAGLSEPDNALITEEFARKIFGPVDPLGRRVRYESSGKEVTVTGVIGKIPTKSTLVFDLILPMSHTKMWSRMENTLILLHPGQDYRTLNEKYGDFFEMQAWEESIRYQLFPLKEVYLEKTVTDWGTFSHGNASSVVALGVVGILILLIGVFNFINIYTAVVLRRGREFGMKKVFGAPAVQVFGQLLLENTLIIAPALLIALALNEVLNPLVRNLLGFDQLPFRAFDLLSALGLLAGLPLLTTLFPFFHYNYASPVTSLRSVGKTGGRSAVRRVFLTFQYILTIGMIVVSLFFLKQLHCMLNADIGYRTEDIIQTTFLKQSSDYNNRGSWERDRERMQEIRQKMDASPLFTAWVSGDAPTGSGSRFNFKFGDGEFMPVMTVAADDSWLKMFGIRLKEGRLFDREQDNFYTYHLIATESALAYYGITDIRTEQLQPEHRWWYSSDRREEMKTNPPYRIVGVVEDLHISHPGIPTPPVVILFNEGYLYDPVLAAVAPGKRQEAIEFLRQLHQETVGGEFTYSFIEDDVKAMYREDRKVAAIYSIFTLLAIGISALGLFSMSLFDIQQRRREIAIRKVNGATTGDVLGLLLKRYLYLLLAAFVIAAPLGWLAIRRYLEGFAIKAPVSAWIFAAALAITAGISLLTLIWQTRKAAGTNPAEVIRSE